MAAKQRSGSWWARMRTRRKRRRAAKKRRLAAMSRTRRVWRRIGLTATGLFALFAVGLMALIAMFYAFSDVPSPQSLPLPQLVTLQYSDGSTLAQLGTVNRVIVPLSEVPEQVRWDVIAAEDRTFYTDPGFSVKGTVRAALSDLTGGDTQGGSGITQQYAKNAYLTDARTLSRKLKELMISVKLARKYSKDQILEFYLNTVYFGRGTYGIEAASRAYFGKDVSKLTVAEGAVLAASLRDPGYYDPATNPQAAHQRWRYVIDGMVAVHRLTRAQADALSYPKVLPVTDGPQLGADGWKYFVYRQVVSELAAHGISESVINTRGLTIRTTIDRKAQTAALDAIHTAFGHLTKAQRNMKNALTAVNPATGAVLAYYGGPNGRGYNGEPDYNDYAGVGARPAGSSFKPFTLATVLTQTLDKAAGKPRLTSTSHVDGSQCVKIEGIKICNDPSDAPYSGPSVTIAYAMKYSLNTTFDLLAAQAGPDNVAETAHRMGISRTDNNGRPTLVDSGGHTNFGIGIGDYPVTPLDQASAFGTLANGGVLDPPYFVQSATASNGQVLYRHDADPQHAIDPKVANDVTMTLEPIAQSSGFGLADGRPSAAKTGTVGIGTTTANSDAWTVGFTPQVSAAVWVGSGDSTHAIVNASGGAEYGRDLPGTTWKLFVDGYLSGTPAEPLPHEQQITNGVDPVLGATPSPTTSAPTTSAPTSPATTSAPPSTPPTSPVTPPTTPSPPPSSPTPTPSRTPTSTPTTAAPPIP